MLESLDNSVPDISFQQPKWSRDIHVKICINFSNFWCVLAMLIINDLFGLRESKVKLAGN